GVVKRLESVMMILWGSPEAFFTSRKPSAPAPPALLIGSSACFIRLCFATMPWTARAIWSAPPPVPAGRMNSSLFVGSQGLAAGAKVPDTAIAVDAASAGMKRCMQPPFRYCVSVGAPSSEALPAGLSFSLRERGLDLDQDSLRSGAGVSTATPFRLAS